MSIWFQESALIQPRTSPPKFARSPCTDPSGSNADSSGYCKVDNNVSATSVFRLTACRAGCTGLFQVRAEYGSPHQSVVPVACSSDDKQNVQLADCKWILAFWGFSRTESRSFHKLA